MSHHEQAARSGPKVTNVGRNFLVAFRLNPLFQKHATPVLGGSAGL